MPRAQGQGYATGQFGKNHLGDLDEYLPTVHGFDEFFGYLYHLDAEDPAHPAYPQDLLDELPRNMIHSWATDTDDPTVMPHWAKVGKQKIEDTGTLYPKRMETVDDEIREPRLQCLDKAKADDKPFFLWLNPTRMHIVTHLSRSRVEVEEGLGTIHEAGMAQLDDIVGATMQKLKDMGVDDNTIVVFHRQRHRSLHLARWRTDALRSKAKARSWEGGFRVPAMIRWPGKAPGRQGRERHHLGLDWFPTFLAAAGDPNVEEDLKKGKKIGDTTYKVHLDGYDQTPSPAKHLGPRTRSSISATTARSVRIVRFSEDRFIDQRGRLACWKDPFMPLRFPSSSTSASILSRRADHESIDYGRLEG